MNEEGVVAVVMTVEEIARIERAAYDRGLAIAEEEGLTARSLEETKRISYELGVSDTENQYRKALAEKVAEEIDTSKPALRIAADRGASAFEIRLDREAFRRGKAFAEGQAREISKVLDEYVRDPAMTDIEAVLKVASILGVALP